MSEYVYYTCTLDTFRGMSTKPVRWLDYESDYALVRDYWSAYSFLSPETWSEARAASYTYAAIIEDDAIVALAAAWRYSEEAWELAAVLVEQEHRQLGYGRTVCSFVTDFILKAGKRATCTTAIDNIPMRKTAECIGYYQVPCIVHPANNA
jgi:GNAT superfamily N-acetyltransferase